MSRTFKLRGQNFIGIEIARDGDRVTLRGAPQGWPFPLEETFHRSELVWMHGDPEPSPEREREFPAEEQARDTNGELFGDAEGETKP